MREGDAEPGRDGHFHRELSVGKFTIRLMWRRLGNFEALSTGARKSEPRA